MPPKARMGRRRRRREAARIARFADVSNHGVRDRCTGGSHDILRAGCCRSSLPGLRHDLFRRVPHLDLLLRFQPLAFSAPARSEFGLSHGCLLLAALAAASGGSSGGGAATVLVVVMM